MIKQLLYSVAGWGHYKAVVVFSSTTGDIIKAFVVFSLLVGHYKAVVVFNSKVWDIIKQLLSSARRRRT